jgi:hypothetical protein
MEFSEYISGLSSRERELYFSLPVSEAKKLEDLQDCSNEELRDIVNNGVSNPRSISLFNYFNGNRKKGLERAIANQILILGRIRSK